MVAAGTRPLHRSHYENFPVASLLVPPHMRPHIAAVYAFARVADDFADEGDLPVDARLALLERWGARLRDAANGQAQREAVHPGEPSDAPRLFERLAATIREKALSVELFEALLSAFRQDVTVHRYATWAEVDDYCRRSANPVGRIVLRIAGYRDDRLDLWSDAICTALQLTNFWQDLRIDVARGRFYVPAEEMRAHGADEKQLAAAVMGPEWRRAVEAAVARTRRLFAEGRPLCSAVSGRLRLELRATWLGGTRILDRIEAGGFDALAQRPVIGPTDLPWFVGRLALWGMTSDRG